MAVAAPSVTTTSPTEGCNARIMLTRAEHRLLAALPDPGTEIEREIWCGLEHGHTGLHWALGQVSADDWWWLCWDETAGRRGFVHREICGVESIADRPGGSGVPCVLPADHPGAHSFTRPA